MTNVVELTHFFFAPLAAPYLFAGLFNGGEPIFQSCIFLLIMLVSCQSGNSIKIQYLYEFAFLIY
jgi:hypothetical protein